MICKISVVCTVYNAERYINESLDSILGQTFQEFELILVNDGSTDNSDALLKVYADAHSNVSLLENKYNEGVPVSRNRAMLFASGDYIAIHDADDVSLPERLEREIEYLESHPEITFMGSHAIKIGPKGSIMGSMVYPPKDTETAFKYITRFKLNPIIDPSSIFKKDTILQNGAYSMKPELRTVQDFELWCRLLSRGYLLSNIQEPLIKYRINPDGVTISQRQKQMQATDIVWARFRRKNFEEVNLKPDYFNQDSYTEYKGN